MKGRTGSTGVETTHEAPEELAHAEQRRGQQSFPGTESFLQRHFQPARVLVAIVALAIASLLSFGVVTYGSKLYQNWRENRLLDRATALLQEGKLSKAAQMARELLDQHPDSLPALSILAD